jgi:hypothetical protein
MLFCGSMWIWAVRGTRSTQAASLWLIDASGATGASRPAARANETATIAPQIKTATTRMTSISIPESSFYANGAIIRVLSFDASRRSRTAPGRIIGIFLDSPTPGRRLAAVVPARKKRAEHHSPPLSLAGSWLAGLLSNLACQLPGAGIVGSLRLQRAQVLSDNHYRSVSFRISRAQNFLFRPAHVMRLAYNRPQFANRPQESHRPDE